MTDIDKAVELAAEFVAGLDECGEPSPNRPMGPLDQVCLARAVLAMAPVVEAARELTAEVEGLTAERDHYRVAMHAHEVKKGDDA
jgi:hypothetical protein